MRVLHINEFGGLQGGVEEYLFSVTSLLREEGHESALVYRQPGIHAGEPTLSSYRIAHANSLAIEEEIASIVAKEQPDVAYVHQIGSPLIIRAVTKQLPAVAYSHGFQTVCPGLGKFYRRSDTVCHRAFSWRCFPVHYLCRCSKARDPRTTHRLMVKTTAMRDALLGVSSIFVGSSYMRALLVQNGFRENQVEFLAPHFLFEPIPPRITAPEDPSLLLYAGRLELEKGLPYLLEALSLVPSPTHLIVAGEGTLRAKYEARAVELGLGNRVQFVGWQSNRELSRLYLRSAAVIMPSVFPEPFGKVGVEALSYGRPVVAFAVGGIPDWLKDGENGYMAKPANSEDLANKITRLLSNPRRAAQMGLEGRRMVYDRYSARQHLESLLTTLGRAVTR